MSRLPWFFTCYVIICIPLEAFKILVFNPRFGKSHVRFLGTIADLLVENGHEVVCSSASKKFLFY